MKTILIYILFFLSIASNAQVWQTNTAKLGDGTGSNKQFLFHAGSVSTDARIRWNNSLLQVEFSNDGVNFYALDVAGANKYIEVNDGLSCTVSGNALTCALKQLDGATDPTTGLPAKMPVKGSVQTIGSYNIRSVTAAQSVVISANTKLGLVASTSTPYYLYEIDTNGAGAMALGLSGNLYDDGQLINVMDESNVVTITAPATPGVITWTGHNLVVGDTVTFTSTGSLPSGLTIGTAYYVVSVATNTFQVSATPGGAAIATGGGQSGVHTGRINNYRMVTTANIYNSVSTHLIGVMNISEVTPGTWASGPTTVTINPKGYNLRQRQFFVASPASAVSIGAGTATIPEFTTVFQCKGTPVAIDFSMSASIGNGSNLTGFAGIYIDGSVQPGCNLNNQAPNCSATPCYLTWAISGCIYSCPIGAHTIEVRANGNGTVNFTSNGATNRNFTIHELY